MAKTKLGKSDILKVFMGGFQIAVILGLTIPFLNVIPYYTDLEFVIGFAPAPIGLLAGAAVIGGSVKEAALKWVVSVPLWFAVVYVIGKLNFSVRLFQRAVGYVNPSYGDTFGWGTILMILAFWALVFLSVGVYLSASKGFSERKRKTVFMVQVVAINIICLGLIAAVIVLNGEMPPVLYKDI